MPTQTHAALLLLVLQVFSTLGMTGVIWFVQVVHYPLFARVGERDFRGYAASHATRTTWVVAPLMLVELATACLLVFACFRPAFVSAREAWAGGLLVGLIWLSTAVLQVPLHDRLQAGYDAAEVRRLVAGNWVRTAAWTARAALVLWWVYAGLGSR